MVNSHISHRIHVNHANDIANVVPLEYLNDWLLRERPYTWAVLRGWRQITLSLMMIIGTGMGRLRGHMRS